MQLSPSKTLRERLHRGRIAVVLPLSFAALLAVQVISAQGAPREDQRGAESFRAGLELFERGEWLAARDAFVRANALTPSPNALLYVGLCHVRLGEHVAAWRALDEAASAASVLADRVPRYARTASIARREIAAVETRVVMIELRVDTSIEGLEVRVGERLIEARGLTRPFATEPGNVQVVASAPGRSIFRASRQLAAGAYAEVDVVLGDAAPRPDLSAVSASSGGGFRDQVVPNRTRGHMPSRQGAGDAENSVSPLVIAGIAVGGGGLVLFTIGAIFGGTANGLYRALERDCPASNVPTCTDVYARVQTGRTNVAIANVGLIGGGIILAGGVSLLIVGLVSAVGRPADSTALPQLARRVPRPFVDPASGSAGIWGSF